MTFQLATFHEYGSNFVKRLKIKNNKIIGNKKRREEWQDEKEVRRKVKRKEGSEEGNKDENRNGFS